MAARKEIVSRAVAQGMPVTKALAIAEIPRSSYYYQPNGRRIGKAPSVYTRCGDLLVKNEIVVNEINNILGEEFIDYGYERTTEELKRRGFNINKKKVYRLMKENHLLFPQIKRKSCKRTFVDLTVPLAIRPLETVELDIKYIYIQGLKRHAYLITMLDVFSRTALVWELNMTMKAKDAVRLVHKLVSEWLYPMNLNPKKLSVKIRTDNGSQFIAKDFQNSLQQVQISNEYIKPATPQQNAHIESFHNTLSRLVCGKYGFEDVQEAREVLERFFYAYNNKRIMKAILNMTPTEFLQAWSKGKINCEIEGREVKYFLREKPTEKNSGSFPSDTFLFLNKNNHLLSNFINPQPI